MGKDDKQQGNAEYPSVGRIVHVTMDRRADHLVFSRPLTITSAGEGQRISGWLQGEPMDTFKGQACDRPIFLEDVQHDSSGEPNTWHWPPRNYAYTGR